MTAQKLRTIMQPVQLREKSNEPYFLELAEAGREFAKLLPEIIHMLNTLDKIEVIEEAFVQKAGLL